MGLVVIYVIGIAPSYSGWSRRIYHWAVKWSNKSGHLVKAVRCDSELNVDNRNGKETRLTEGFKRDAVALVTEQYHD